MVCGLFDPGLHSLLPVMALLSTMMVTAASFKLALFCCAV
jgi:hypothetical protein